MKISQEEILEIAVHILKEHRAVDEKNGMRLASLLKKIKEKIEENNPEINIKESTIYGVIREEAKKEGGNIFSGGPHRGYFYIESPSEDEDIAKEDEENRKNICEKDLYPIVELWLREKKQYGVISEVHNKTRNKKWGNPDIVGVNVYDEFGVRYLEVVTIEVKPNLKDWRQYIFEAVSHKRFADRAYFMFWVTEAEGMKDLEEMYMYADKYKVGLCQITISEGDLKGWEGKSEGEKLEIIDGCIIELFPAPIDDAITREKLYFLKNLGVVSNIHFDAKV